MLASFVEVQTRQTDVVQIVAAAHPSRRLAGRLNRRQEKRNQNADDRNNDQQLDKRKRPTPRQRRRTTFHESTLSRSKSSAHPVTEFARMQLVRTAFLRMSFIPEVASKRLKEPDASACRLIRLAGGR